MSAAKRTVVRAIAIATLLILLALAYMRCSDPYWRCKRLLDAQDRPTEAWSEKEFETYEELGCGEWPGLG